MQCASRDLIAAGGVAYVGFPRWDEIRKTWFIDVNWLHPSQRYLERLALQAGKFLKEREGYTNEMDQSIPHYQPRKFEANRKGQSNKARFING
jgi:hypothetical protein